MTLAERLAEVRRRIERAGGGPEVTVLPVTKGFGPDAIADAVAAGCGCIGESYAQELLAKLDALDALNIPRPEVHFIGRLQSRKVRMLGGAVDVWQSIDRLALLDELERRVPGARLMVQVNVSAEPQKGGCPPGEAATLVAEARRRGLVVEGLMTVGRTGPSEATRSGFALLRGLADEVGVRERSMGMSEDLDVAVAEGSTMVRVGTLLFGERPPQGEPPK